MKRILLALTAALLLVSACGPKKAQFTFDGSKEMSGTKFAIKDINPNLPADWDD